MASFFVDGSALAKRYVPETGSALVDFILDTVPEPRIFVLTIGTAEVVSVLVRRRNAGALSVADFSQAMVELQSEIIHSTAKHLLPFDNAVVIEAFAYIISHSINATDAIVLRMALGVAQHLRNQADDLVLVASDQRLLRAAEAEGLATFNPETQDQATLSAKVGSN